MPLSCPELTPKQSRKPTSAGEDSRGCVLLWVTCMEGQRGLVHRGPEDTGMESAMAVKENIRFKLGTRQALVAGS